MSVPTPLFTLIGFTVLLFVIVIILVVIFVQMSGRSRKSAAKAPKKGSGKASPTIQEILRLWRDPDTGRLVSEFQGRAVQDPSTLSQSEHDYLVRLAQDWTTWLGFPEAQPAVQVETSPAAPAIPAIPSSPDIPTSPAAEPAPTAAAAVAAPAATPAVTEAQAVVPAPPLSQVTPVVTSLPEPATPRSIVQQVDDILQEKLAAYPTPVPTIHLVEDPRGGVFVWVDNIRFQGIESITDPQVRTIIRSAVVEWEHRAGK